MPCIIAEFTHSMQTALSIKPIDGEKNRQDAEMHNVRGYYSTASNKRRLLFFLQIAITAILATNAQIPAKNKAMCVTMLLFP